jgi:hypothetical protein
VLLACLPKALQRLPQRHAAFLEQCLPVVQAIVHRAVYVALEEEPPCCSPASDDAGDSSPHEHAGFHALLDVARHFLVPLQIMLSALPSEAAQREAAAALYRLAAAVLPFTADMALLPHAGSSMQRLSAPAQNALLEPLQAQSVDMIAAQGSVSALVTALLGAPATGQGEQRRGFDGRDMLQALGASGGEADPEGEQKESQLLGWALAMHAYHAVLPDPTAARGGGGAVPALREAPDLALLAATTLLNAAGQREVRPATLCINIAFYHCDEFIVCLLVAAHSQKVLCEMQCGLDMCMPHTQQAEVWQCSSLTPKICRQAATQQALCACCGHAVGRPGAEGGGLNCGAGGQFRQAAGRGAQRGHAAAAAVAGDHHGGQPAAVCAQRGLLRAGRCAWRLLRARTLLRPKITLLRMHASRHTSCDAPRPSTPQGGCCSGAACVNCSMLSCHVSPAAKQLNVEQCLYCRQQALTGCFSFWGHATDANAAGCC